MSRTGAPSPHSPAPTLVVLAAGIGSRYGRPKQLEPVGPRGATLMDYSVYDARRAGFRRVVFVVRPELEAVFRPFLHERSDAPIETRVALQRLEDLPAGVAVRATRVKPWGTAHAVLAAESEIDGPFAVVNADDFYGRGAFAVLAEFLAAVEPGPPLVFANVAYPLRETLSAAGGVNRAVCRVGGDGWLEGIEEVTDIRPVADGGYAGTDQAGRPVRVEGEALVSMNMWAFTPAVFALFRTGFAEFLGHRDAARREFLIPGAIRDPVRRGQARVRLLRANSRWLGITFPEDRPLVEAALREVVAAGEYPERLWP